MRERMKPSVVVSLSCVKSILGLRRGLSPLTPSPESSSRAGTGASYRDLKLRKQPLKKGFLRVQAILRLLPNHAGWPLDDLVGDFLAPMSGQTVQYDGLGVRSTDPFLIQAVAHEGLSPGLDLGFLAHGGEHVGRKHMAAGHGLARILRDMDLS